MRLLFVSHQNKKRSKLVEEVFRNKFKTQSAGIYNDPVTSEQLNWADVVFVMEEHYTEELNRRFPELCAKKKIVALNLPAILPEDKQELASFLEKQVKELI